MREKRSLEAMEKMIHKLPPVNKKRKIQPPTSTVDQEQALANQLDDLITTDPQATNPQPMTSTTDDKNHNLNVCPFHECSLILFEAQSNGNVYIKCEMDQCPIFMHEADSACDYLSNVCSRLHESYLKQKRIFICAAKRQFRSEWAKQKKIQVAPMLYVKTETVDSFSGMM